MLSFISTGSSPDWPQLTRVICNFYLFIYLIKVLCITEMICCSFGLLLDIPTIKRHFFSWLPITIEGEKSGRALPPITDCMKTRSLEQSSIPKIKEKTEQNGQWPFLINLRDDHQVKLIPLHTISTAKSLLANCLFHTDGAKVTHPCSWGNHSVASWWPVGESDQQSHMTAWWTPRPNWEGQRWRALQGHAGVSVAVNERTNEQMNDCVWKWKPPWTVLILKNYLKDTCYLIYQ